MATAMASPETEKAVGLLKDRKTAIQDEERRIDKALASLTGTTSSNGGSPRRLPRPKADAPTPKRTRKVKGGKRADQAVALIEKEPGIGASDIAKTMKIKPNYLYRVLGGLEKEGRIRKDGRQYFPAD